MFLLRLKTRHWERAKLFDDYEAAKARAIEHVGTHNPDDGCSTEPYVFQKLEKEWFSIWRASSFGKREARVDRIDRTNELEIGSW